MNEHPEEGKNEWWKTFHVREMADLFLDRNSKQELCETIEFLERELHLQPGDHVFDQCCGAGTLGNQLACRGYRVTGCDLCDVYLEIARSSDLLMSKDGIAIPNYVIADAFHFMPSEPCHGALNWYSSFGYSQSDTQNVQMIQKAFDALLPNAYFALDIPNYVGLFRSFKPEMNYEGTSLGRKVLLTRRSFLDHENGLLLQDWMWTIEGKLTETKKSALRVYLPYQICNILEKCGFANIRILGDVHSSQFHSDSPRLIAVARKPTK